MKTLYLKRFLPLIIILLALSAVYFTGAYHYLSFEYIKENHFALEDFVARHMTTVPLIYILIYITVTTLSIPGAAFLSLLGGYLFHQPMSTIYVVFSATCGATIVFLAARMALSDTLRQKAGPFLKKMEGGFQENAVSYMLFMRLVPIFPFWLANISPAFFGVRLRTFIWTTAIGIIPGSFVFTLAGSGLEKIFDIEGPISMGAIFNTQLKIALCLLGFLSLLPILLKKAKTARVSKWLCQNIYPSLQPAFCKKFNDQEMRFICDQMLVELGRWLRAAGYDTKIMEPTTSDKDIYQCAKKEKRFLLTRDRHFLEMDDPDKLIIFMTCNSTEECIAEVSSRLKINWLLRPFSRCVICNTNLSVPDSEMIEKQVPTEVHSRTKEFWYCPTCQKVYWEGSHTEHMLHQLQSWQTKP